MPTPTVLTEPTAFGGGTMTPPAAGQSIASAPVSAQEVWAHDYLDTIPQVQIDEPAGGGTNELFLGRYFNGAIGQYRLAWLLERTGVAMKPPPFDGIVTGSAPASTEPAPICEFYTLDAVVDATTGQELETGIESSGQAAPGGPGSPVRSTPMSPSTVLEIPSAGVFADSFHFHVTTMVIAANGTGTASWRGAADAGSVAKATFHLTSVHGKTATGVVDSSTEPNRWAPGQTFQLVLQPDDMLAITPSGPFVPMCGTVAANEPAPPPGINCGA